MSERRQFPIIGVGTAVALALGGGAYFALNYKPEDPVRGQLRAEARACAGTETEEDRRSARMNVVLDNRFSRLGAAEVYEVLDRLCPLEEVSDHE